MKSGLDLWALLMDSLDILWQVSSRCHGDVFFCKDDRSSTVHITSFILGALTSGTIGFLMRIHLSICLISRPYLNPIDPFLRPWADWKSGVVPLRIEKTSDICKAHEAWSHRIYSEYTLLKTNITLANQWLESKRSCFGATWPIFNGFCLAGFD